MYIFSNFYKNRIPITGIQVTYTYIKYLSSQTFTLFHYYYSCNFFFIEEKAEFSNSDHEIQRKKRSTPLYVEWLAAL